MPLTLRELALRRLRFSPERFQILPHRTRQAHVKRVGNQSVADRDLLQTFDRLGVCREVLQIEIVTRIHAESDFQRETRGLAMLRQDLLTLRRPECMREWPRVQFDAIGAKFPRTRDLCE